MIGGVTKFGGGSRDSRALAAHLAKPQPAGSLFVAMNSAAPDVGGAIAEARVMAAAAGIGDRPFLHVHLSPSSALDPARLVEAAGIVCRELGVTDQPVGIELHGKPRLDGNGDWHAHLVIGRAGASGTVLPSGFEKIRLETAVRVAEFEIGEGHVLGRHLQSSLRHLERTGREDVVASLRAAFGPEPGKPESSASPSKRQALDRQGIDLSSARAAVRAAWAASDGPAAFRAALAAEGFAVAPGTKPGVWIVTSGETEIGALDRLVKEKRGDVAERMMEVQRVPEASVAADPGPAPRDDEPGRDRRGVDAHRGSEAASPPGPPRGAGERRPEPDRRAEGTPGGGAAVAAPAPSGGGGREQPARRPRRAAEALAVHRLHRVPDARLKALAADLRQVARVSLDRVRDALVARRSAAVLRRDAPPAIPPVPTVLASLRGEIDAAHATGRSAFYDRLSEVRAAEKISDRPEPTGLVSRILGYHAEWARSRERALALIAEVHQVREDAAALADRLQRRALPLERQYGRDVKAAEDRARDDRRAAERELVVVAEALRLLASDPDLARLGEDGVLAKAERSLDRAQRERERLHPSPRAPDPVEVYEGPRLR